MGKGVGKGMGKKTGREREVDQKGEGERKAKAYEQKGRGVVMK
jgi:hypothetical protein